MRAISSFNGKPKAIALQDIQQTHHADAFGWP